MTMRRIATVALTILGVTGPLVWAQARGQNPPPASPAPGAPAASRADAYYNVTMGHLYQQEFENAGHAEDAAKAIDFYKKAYALDPNSPEIGEDLAEIYFLSHRSGDAINEAQELIRRNPNDLSARRLLARIYIRSLGDLTNPTEQQQTITAAIAQLQEIVKLDSSDNEAALWLARLLRLNNHDDQAEQVLRGILAKDADNKGAIDQLSLLLLDHNESDAAISLLESFLQQAPSADLYDRLGDAYEQVQQTSKAEEAYRRAVSMEPDQTDPRRHLAQSLYDQGRYADALAEYQHLAALEPDSVSDHLRMSEIYRRLQQFDKAQEQVLLAKKLAPGNLEVIYNEAAIYEAEEHYDDAIQVLSDAVTQVKGESEFAPARRRSLGILYQLLGQLYRDEQNDSAAINTFEEMVRLGPEEDLRGRMLIIETYRADHDLTHAFAETTPGAERASQGPRPSDHPGHPLRREQSAGAGDADFAASAGEFAERSGDLSQSGAGVYREPAFRRCRESRALRGKAGPESFRQGDAGISAGRHVRTAEEIRPGRTSVQGRAGDQSAQCARRSTITAICWRSAACGWMKP